MTLKTISRISPPALSKPGPSDSRASEATAIHTRILRMTLAVEESRSYWQNVDPAVTPADRTIPAFEQRWFGAKSLERVRYLLAAFVTRYDSFFGALTVLRRWGSMDVTSRQLICHWHMQLSDPIYRRFTGDYLSQRREMRDPKVDRDVVLRWIRAEYPDKWSESTAVQFASKLLSSALEAGLVGRRDPRSLLFPRVSDHALAYLLYLLRETRFEGTLTHNPYLASVGIDEDVLSERAKVLPGLTMRRMMSLVEFEWTYADLADWAQEVTS